MSNNDKKILLLADLHYMVVSPQKQKGQVKTGLSRIVEWIIDIWKRSWADRLFRKIISKS